MTHQSSPAANVFDAAKAIVESVKQLDKPHQEQAIRFASESLGLSNASHSKPPTETSLPASEIAPPTTDPQTRPTDIKQFTAAKAPKSDQQFAAVVAYFHQFEAQEDMTKDAISMEDLKNAARLVQRRLPGKFALNNAKNSGYLDSAGRGKFKLSPVGENLVAITLPGTGAVQAGQKRKSAKKKPGKKKVGKKKRRSQKRTKRGG